MCIPVIVWYNISQCMVSITKINAGIKESILGHQKCNTSHILIFDGYNHKMRESFMYPIYYLDDQNHYKPYQYYGKIT
jgi:hypothetical protein